tara:strand:- start:1159 stop:1329 length:171 start_codon:yes stop_codon:yes gene_type:complete
MELEKIFELCIKNLAEYEKKQLIIMLTKFMITKPSQLDTEAIYKRAIQNVIITKTK